MSDDKRRERLRYRSWHRGTREMDLLLGPFADAYLHVLSPTQLDAYEALLEQPDTELYDLLTGDAAADELPMLIRDNSPSRLWEKR